MAVRDTGDYSTASSARTTKWIMTHGFRHQQPIATVMRHHMPSRGMVLEIASGSGEHILHFANVLSSDLIFQPSDPDADARASIDAWVASSDAGNVLPAIHLDASAKAWPMQHADAVVCINMIHIAPWDAAVGLMRGAGSILAEGGLLYLYGPFRRDGRHTAPSNEAFDHDLRRRNAQWGVRDLETVAELAEGHGFAPPIIINMSANNLSLVFRRR